MTYRPKKCSLFFSFYAGRCTATYLFWKTLSGRDLIYDLGILLSFSSFQVEVKTRFQEFGSSFFYHSSQFYSLNQTSSFYTLSLDYFMGKRKTSTLSGHWWSCGCPDVCVVVFGENLIEVCQVCHGFLCHLRLIPACVKHVSSCMSF